MEEENEHPYYGRWIIPRDEKAYIDQLLRKYREEPATEELKKKIWDELQMEKYLGHVTIPFKVALRLDPYGKFPNYVEVILDTKV